MVLRTERLLSFLSLQELKLQVERACDRAANDERRVSFPDFPVKPESVYFASCSKQGLEMDAVILHRVGLLEYFSPKQGQGFKPSVAPLYPSMGQVPPRGIFLPFRLSLAVRGSRGQGKLAHHSSCNEFPIPTKHSLRSKRFRGVGEQRKTEERDFARMKVGRELK